MRSLFWGVILCELLNDLCFTFLVLNSSYLCFKFKFHSGFGSYLSLPQSILFCGSCSFQYFAVVNVNVCKYLQTFCVTVSYWYEVNKVTLMDPKLL